MWFCLTDTIEDIYRVRFASCDEGDVRSGQECDTVSSAGPRHLRY